MKRLPLGGTVGFPIAASLAGCYWLTSYEDLTSGLADAGAESTSFADVGAESASPVDASLEAPVAVVEAGRFCPDDAGPHVYCMDFDGVDAGSLGLWTHEAHADIVDGVSVSPPSSLSVHLDGPDVGTGGSYTVPFPFMPISSRLEFQLNMGALSGEVTTMSIALAQDSTQTWRSLQLLVSATGALQVQEYISAPDGGAGYGHAIYPADGGGLTPGTWHHVVLTLTVNDATQQYFSGLTVDGQVVEEHAPLRATWAQGTANVTVGSSWCRVGGSHIYFDNVRADFTL